MRTRSRNNQSKRSAKPTKLRTPSYRLHRPSGRAVVTIAGKDHYLGDHGSDESKEAYRRLIAEFLASGTAPTPRNARGRSRRDAPELTVADLAARFWEQLERRLGVAEAKRKHDRIALALRPVVALYGNTAAAEFGPKSLRVVQQEMVRSGLTRGLVNQRIQFVRRVFRWGVAEELLPGDVASALEAVDNLRRGDFDAREGRKIDPVARDQVEPVLARVSRQVAAMIELQWHTGMRPGEVVQLRPIDLERSDDVWIYRPPTHKTAHHGKSREVFLGPNAQAVLRPFLDRVPAPPADHPLFSPAEAETERNLERSRERQSKPTPSQRRRKRKRNPAKSAQDAYTVASYRRAIDRAIALRNAPRVRKVVADALGDVLEPRMLEQFLAPLRRLPAALGEASIERAFAQVADRARADLPDGFEVASAAERAHEAIEAIRHDCVEDWHPHRLRHSAATRIRKEHGLEASRVVLGHSSPAVTEVYAEIDSRKARDIMEKLG